MLLLCITIWCAGLRPTCAAQRCHAATANSVCVSCVVVCRPQRTRRQLLALKTQLLFSTLILNSASPRSFHSGPYGRLVGWSESTGLVTLVQNVFNWQSPGRCVYSVAWPCVLVCAVPVGCGGSEVCPPPAPLLKYCWCGPCPPPPSPLSEHVACGHDRGHTVTSCAQLQL